MKPRSKHYLIDLFDKTSSTGTGASKVHLSPRLAVAILQTEHARLVESADEELAHCNALPSSAIRADAAAYAFAAALLRNTFHGGSSWRPEDITHIQRTESIRLGAIFLDIEAVRYRLAPRIANWPSPSLAASEVAWKAAACQLGADFLRGQSITCEAGNASKSKGGTP